MDILSKKGLQSQESRKGENGIWKRKAPLIAAALTISMAASVSLIHYRNVERSNIRMEQRAFSQRKMADVYKLSDELKSHLEYERGATDLQTVKNAMETFKRLRLRYEKKPGKDATRILVDGSGNCVSFSRLLLIMLKDKGIRAQQIDVFSEDTGISTLHSAIAIFIDAPQELRHISGEFVIADPTRDAIGSQYRDIRILEPEQEYANYLFESVVSSTDTAKIVSVLNEALSLDPDSIYLLRNLGIALTKQGDYDVAKRYFKRAMKLDKTNGSRMAYIDAMINQRAMSSEDIDRKYKEIDKEIEKIKNPGEK